MMRDGSPYLQKSYLKVRNNKYNATFKGKRAKFWEGVRVRENCPKDA